MTMPVIHAPRVETGLARDDARSILWPPRIGALGGVGMRIWTSAALAAAVALSGAPGLAETGLLDRLRLAHGLYQTGLAQREPLYLLAAARLRKSVPLTPAAGAEGAPLGWREILAAADPMIAGDPTLMGLAEDLRAERAKGVADGPVYSIVQIAPGGTDTYPDLVFTGGQYAEVYVEGASTADLNLLIHDAKGRLVCSDTDISAIAYCGWRPAEDGAFVVTVVNQGPGGGRYAMMTN